MFKIVRIKGHSMYPRYQDGDFLILRRLSDVSSRYKVGQIVVFQHETYGTLVKRIEQVDAVRRRLFVLSEHEDGLDSRQLGWIDVCRVTGRVLFHIGRGR